MKSKAGFTLVELLVVMAIISILAAIAVPNIVTQLRKGQVTRAFGDIGGIETALTSVLADSGRAKLEQLFNPQGVATIAQNNFGATSWPPTDEASFRAATELYTRTLYAILRSGRSVLGSQDPLKGYNYAAVLQNDIVQKLGTGYLSELATDPWDNLYNIYPGPWTARRISVDTNGQLRAERAPIPFRIYARTDAESNLPGASSQSRDGLEVLVDADLDGQVGGPGDFEGGYPAPSNMIAYIWSNGLNLVSGQVVYRSASYDLTNTQNNYDLNQEVELIGGGDDVNNWDPGQSWSRAI